MMAVRVANTKTDRRSFKYFVVLYYFISKHNVLCVDPSFKSSADVQLRFDTMTFLISFLFLM